LLSGEEDLGAGYFYIPDGRNSIIIKSIRNNSPSTGHLIIPATVIKFSFNEQFVIAKTKDRIKNEDYYWIISKKDVVDIQKYRFKPQLDSALMSNILGPIDSATFQKELQQRAIDLRFY